MNLKTKFGLALGPVVLAILLVVARLVHGSWTKEGFAISLLIGTSGVVIGWLIGLLLTPYTKREEKKFTVYTSGLTGLVSGYVFTKIIDPTLTHLFKDGAILENSVYGANLLIFAAALIASVISSYAYREYVTNDKQN